MVNVFIWTVFGIFLILMVASSLAMFMSAPDDTLAVRQTSTTDRKMEEKELVMFRKWFADITAGRALSEKDHGEVTQCLSRLRSGKSFLCVAHWLVYLLEKCPSTDWHTISFRVVKSHEALDELRYKKTPAKVADNISTCFAGCDSLMYVMRKNELLVETA